MPPHRSASLRAALAPPCPGAAARVTSPSAGCAALAAGRRTQRANAPHRSRSCWRRLSRCSQPRGLRSTCEHPRPVVARCTSLLTRQILGALAAMILPCGACSPGFRAPSARGSRLRRSRGLRPAFGRPASPSKQEEAPGSLSPNASFRQRQPASGPFLGMPLWQAASPPPCRAPWRCPAWRNRGQGGCHSP